MNGIICIYKEKGMTSFDVVAKVRRIYKTKKVGHGGTLDPMAEGVLPVFIGDATKAVDFCPDDTKQYVAGFQFGITTDTQDITGKVLTTCDAYVSRNKMPMIERMFKGVQMQTPPMYSAVKVNGQRLYDLARKGEIVNRQPRKINIYDIQVTKYEYNSGELSVTCSKGTYIRTLIHDIGQKLGTGAVMTSLVRARSGVFRLEDCYYLSELEGKTDSELEAMLMPLETLYGQLPKAHLDEQQTKLFRNGATLDADRIRFDTIYDKGYYIEGSDGVFLGLGKIGLKHELDVLRRFNTDAGNVMKPITAENQYTKGAAAMEPVEETAEIPAEGLAEAVMITKETAPAVEGENTEAITVEAPAEIASEPVEEAKEEPVAEITEEAETETIKETAVGSAEIPAEEPAEAVMGAEETALAVEGENTEAITMEAPAEIASETIEEAKEEPVAEITEEAETETIEEAAVEYAEIPAEEPAEAVMAAEETAPAVEGENTEAITVEAPAETIEEAKEEPVAEITEEAETETIKETAVEYAEIPAEEPAEAVMAAEETAPVVEGENTEAITMEAPAEIAPETIEEAKEEPVEEITEEAETETIEEAAVGSAEIPAEGPAEAVMAAEETAPVVEGENTEAITGEAPAEIASETIEEAKEEPVAEITEEAETETIEEAAVGSAEIPAEEPAEAVMAAEETAPVVEGENTEAITVEAPAEIASETIEEAKEEPVAEITEEAETETIEEAAVGSAEIPADEQVKAENVTDEVSSIIEEENIEEIMKETSVEVSAEISDESVEELNGEPNETTSETVEKFDEIPDEYFEDSIIARAVANLNVYDERLENTREASEEMPGVASESIIETAVAHVTTDNELETILFDGSGDTETANTESSEREQPAPGIDNDYLAYLESAFVDDDEEFEVEDEDNGTN